VADFFRSSDIPHQQGPDTGTSSSSSSTTISNIFNIWKTIIIMPKNTKMKGLFSVGEKKEFYFFFAILLEFSLGEKEIWRGFPSLIQTTAGILKFFFFLRCEKISIRYDWRQMIEYSNNHIVVMQTKFALQKVST